MIKSRLSLDEYEKGVTGGDRVILSRAITLIESTLVKDQELGSQLLDRLLPHTGNSVRIGITGIPGVGKSTFIESFGGMLTPDNKVAVLAIDPSSEKTRGSILGDKTRMTELSRNPNAYIRPSPTATNLGGVASRTREVMLLCEAAGFNIILIETVGVGQSETVVKGMVDFFLLLMIAGAGDEMQGIKKGIVEMADTIAINKDDAADSSSVQQAREAYQQALHILNSDNTTWTPKVVTCSGLTGGGMEDIWAIIQKYVQERKNNGQFEAYRAEQHLKWMHESISSLLKADFYSNPKILKALPKLEQAIQNGKKHPIQAARELIALFRKG